MIEMSVEKLSAEEEAAFKLEVIGDLTRQLANEQIDLAGAVEEVLAVNARIYEMREDGEFYIASGHDFHEELNELIDRLDSATYAMRACNAEVVRIKQRIAYIEAN